MKLVFNECYAEDCESFITLSNGSIAEIEVNQTRLIRVNQILNERDRQSIKSSLGIPENVATSDLIECLKALQTIPATDKERQLKVAVGSRLMKVLEGSANFSTIISNLIAISNSGITQKLIALLPK